ncbi:hypothetical protein [Nevskia ramosa]|uniref:hypothetical protein n=1 Tax=Nevskia ramosa TaxID=64002 RepID=UPI0003B3C96A|nr:hypothetical protein [Nevskia ramosa]
MNLSNSKRWMLQDLIRKLLAAAWIVGSLVVLGLPHTEAWRRISTSSAPPKGTTAAATVTTKSVETEGASRSRIIITNGWWV